MEIIHTQALVIGSGVAGLFAASHLAEKTEVLLLTKSRMQDANSYYAQGGIASVWDPSDSFEEHIKDTVDAGAGLCDQNAVKILVQEGPGVVEEIISLGTKFDSLDDKLLLTLEGGHHHRRILHAGGDSTGREIELALLKATQADPRIKYLEDFLCVDFVINDGKIQGVWGFKGNSLTPVFVASNVIILATGGLGSIFPETTNPPQATGDGIAMAWAAGAALADMEFIQFHPTALAVEGLPRSLISEAVRGEGAFLVNESGERFMGKYHPMADLAPRDIVSQAEVKEMKMGGWKRVFLDARHIDKHVIQRRFPSIEAMLGKANLSLTRNLIPVSPAAHYLMGGIATDHFGRTTVNGLYAIGEVACTGVHGANRLASNSLLECLVFSKRAAFAAVEDGGLGSPPVKPLYNMESWNIPALSLVSNTMREPAKHRNGVYSEDAQTFFPENAIKTLIQDHLGIIRNRDGLSIVSDKLGFCLHERVSCPLQGLFPDRVALRNLAVLAALISRFAFSRTESRGAHFRTDYPTVDPKWNFRQIIRNTILGKLEI